MLTGVGGIGKTNLCLQVGQQMLDTFPDGVWFVALAPLADPALVGQTAAHTLGLRAASDTPILEVLLTYLAAKSCLLILDNCEHVIAAAAQFAQTVLHTCHHVKILASSREALAVPGEVQFRVPPLAVPPVTQEMSSWQQYEAMRLFVDRATAVLPQFQVTADNITSLAQICQRLDGIPLALELAAARVRVLTAAQIAVRLDDRFRLLTGGSRTALPRQQTLRALIDWSWELLSSPAQQLLQRLSVFAGDMRLAAIEAVAAGSGVDVYDILDLLDELVNKSMVIALRIQGQETRYRLLETIRQYAQEQLAQAGQTDIFRQRHLAYYQQWGVEAEQALTGPEQGSWFKRLPTELDNIRAALGWAQVANPESGLLLVNSLYRFWIQGYMNDGLFWLNQLLSQTESITVTTKARALWVQGRLAYQTTDSELAIALTEDSLALSRPPSCPRARRCARDASAPAVGCRRGRHR
jgi:non-specific serine/threonine protein kinase